MAKSLPKKVKVKVSQRENGKFKLKLSFFSWDFAIPNTFRVAPVKKNPGCTALYELKHKFKLLLVHCNALYKLQCNLLRMPLFILLHAMRNVHRSTTDAIKSLPFLFWVCLFSLWRGAAKMGKSAKTSQSFFFSSSIKSWWSGPCWTVWWRGRCGGWKSLLHSSISPGSAWALGGGGGDTRWGEVGGQNLTSTCETFSSFVLLPQFSTQQLPGAKIISLPPTVLCHHPIVPPTRCDTWRLMLKQDLRTLLGLS